MSDDNSVYSFCLLKTEALVLGKQDFIQSKIRESGLMIENTFLVRLKFEDIFLMYRNWQPVLATIFRFPQFFDLPLLLLHGDNAISRMHNLKYVIREDIWGFKYDKGGFLHAPDSDAEYQSHTAILRQRIIDNRECNHKFKNFS